MCAAARNGAEQRQGELPWGADHAMYAADYPLLAGANENVLMRRILEDSGLRGRFFFDAAFADLAAFARTRPPFVARQVDLLK